MDARNNSQKIIFPPTEVKVQSPYLYLQSAGSTGLDGSTYGAHLRWLLLRNLGETHLAKGDYATTSLNFNRPDDYVTLLRSRYITRFPTIVDFSLAPGVVNDPLAFWIYTVINTNTVVYIHFRDAAKYAAVRTGINPSLQPLQFVQKYCPGLIEAEVKDKLFFATEFDVVRDPATVLRAEALSVEENVPLSEVFVSCRREFTDANWCPPVEATPPTETRMTDEPMPPIQPAVLVPSCCGGPNLLSNGGFENDLAAFGYETDYLFQGGAKAGAINVATNAQLVNGNWKGFPHTGEQFLTVDGSVQEGKAVLRFHLKVEPQTDYCFTGWLSTLFTEDVSIPLQFRFTSADGTVKSFAQSTPATVGVWEEFTVAWNSVASHTVTVEIISLSRASLGNDFGIDDLCFCGTEAVPGCCGGPNLVTDGGFENELSGFFYQTDYVRQGGAHAGSINVTSNASTVNGRWVGLPHSGKNLLAVDGSVKPGSAVLRFTMEVEPQTDYCFTAWLATLYAEDVSIKLEFRFSSGDGIGPVQSFQKATPAAVGVWEEATFTWNSGAARAVTVEIVSTSIESIGNDFGLDDLFFCKSKEQPKGCLARIRSENIRSVRFEVDGGYPRRLELETYDDYIAGAVWETLDRLALTKDDSTAFSRLESVPNSVNGHWQKYNDNALVNVSNYKDRWTLAGGLSEGVQRYIARSDTDPMAVVTLQGAVQPQDGSIQISMLDALRMVSLDFHVARMLGLGYLDRDIANDTDEYIYLGIYDTDGALDDTHIARFVRHYCMGVPTKPLDDRLPDSPTLKPVAYGLTVDNGEPQPAYLTDPQGYTPDGLSRYVNLFVEPEDDSAELGPFFVPPVEFCSIDKTSGVFYGVEHRMQGEAAWRKPEIAHDAAYKDLDTPVQFETLPLPNNANPENPILRHDERENGVHEYGAYSINWFSRVSPVGNVVGTDATVIKKANRLLPPANLAVQLIQPESPLMLTTSAEQDMLTHLTGPDKTLVRVTFDYFHVQDINYAFADTVELLFRTEMPRNVVGAIKSVADDPADGHNAIIGTTGYTVNSQGTIITPALDPALFANFIGGVLSCQQQNYIVTKVSQSTAPGEGPIFTVQKSVSGNASKPGSTGTFVTVQKYTGPQLDPNAQVMFMAVENMADSNSWGTPNPLSKIVNIGDSAWTTHSETYVQDGETITLSLRGIVATAVITQDLSAATAGVYLIQFQTYQLPHHQQHSDPDPVDWYKGAVRVSRVSDPNGPKKVLEVLLVAHLGDGQPLALHVIDSGFDPNDEIITGVPVTVNYYPGYKVNLHADVSHNFTEATILPAAGEGNRKTWLGSRSCDTTQAYHSAVGIPAPIIALEFVKPLAPEKPLGGEFATRPDFYYKSSYTFRINFAPNHKPFAVVMYRADDEAILRALYSDLRYVEVRQQLEQLGEADAYRSDRWKNLLGFDYVYDVNTPDHPYYDPTGSSPNGTFRRFPRESGYAFPNPDKAWPNGPTPGSILSDLKEAISGAFTALTEMPLIFDFIRGPSYEPVPKRQNIRNAQGTLLDPNDPEFDMAPMAKKTGTGFEIQFTDFTLDGTGNNVFFYCGREIGNGGRLGDAGAIAGPVQLINTRPPDQPGVKKVYVKELTLLDNTGPAVNFEINAYPDAQKVGRMLIYRANNFPADALSVRTMQLVKTVDFAATNQVGTPSILLSDDFENGFIPYGDPLYYRIVALRKVKNADGGTDWAPSQPSKLLLTAVIDTINPEAPEITFTSDGLSGSPATLTGVTLSWPTTVYNGTYYLDKMSSAGNWVTIYHVKTNTTITVNLAATDLGTDVLPKESPDDGSPIYNRFRVRVENSSGLFSLTDKVLVV